MKVNRYLIIFIGFTLLLCSIALLLSWGHATATVSQTVPVTRLSGADRYQTAVEISKAGWNSSDYVILSVGDGDDKFADALAGSPVSYVFNGPTLLTPSHKLDDSTLEEIKRLGATNAIILGGYGVISPDIETELKTMNINVKRLWGMDRYETAVRIADEIRSVKPFSKVFLTTGEEFHYAMMIDPFASRNYTPILFSQKDTLAEVTRKALDFWDIEEVEIIGNSNVISQSVEDSISAMGIKVSRIGGVDIEDTNINVINKYGTLCPFFAVARKDIFTDGLAGASFSAMVNMPILLVDQIDVSPGALDLINKLNYTSAYIFGGPGAVSERIYSILEKRTPYVSIYGNTSGNITIGAYSALKGEWIYYLNDKDGKKLYKIKTDGTGKTKLCDDKPLDINVVGDFIYYENMSDGNKIYKIKTDGSNRTKLNDDESWDLNVVNNYIYFTGNTEGGKIYRMSVDGSGKMSLNTERSECVNVVEDWIYYSNWDDGKKLYKIKTDGTGNVKIGDDEAWYSSVAGDYIYYCNGSDEQTLYRIKTDGTERLKIAEDNAQWINVSGDYIYYSNGSDGNKLYKIKNDGTEKTKIFDDTACIINIIGDWIYFSKDLEGLMLYRIKADGSELTEIN